MYLELKNICWHNIFKDINIKVEERQNIVIQGNSPSGKTVLSKLLLCLPQYIPTGGTIEFCDKHLLRLSYNRLVDFRKTIGYVFQIHGLINNQNVLNNIALPLLYNTYLSRKEIYKWVDRLLEKYNLTDIRNRLVDDLSGYESKMVNLLRALIKEPKIIIFDEPTYMLDNEKKVLMMEIIENLIKKENKYFIIFSYDDDIVNKFGEFYYML